MLYILAIGAGGGGGGGASGSSGNPRGGGGGGGSGGVNRVLVPAAFIPDRLTCNMHSGGQGGAADTNGTSSGNTIVIIPSMYGGNFLESVAWTDNSQAGGGLKGTSLLAGTGGSGGSILEGSGVAGLGHLQGLGGQSGFAGGVPAGAIGTNITIRTDGGCISGGAGGAGTTSADFAGGSVTAIANTLISDYRPTGAAAGSFDGPGGFALWRPFFMFGGLGGSSSNTGVGGNGGIGSIGCGGGGGGGGITGGKGGDGGPGAVLFIAW